MIVLEAVSGIPDFECAPSLEIEFNSDANFYQTLCSWLYLRGQQQYYMYN
jgi:hypothetical protein